MDIISAVEQAYVLKEQGDYSAPNCPFLRFPDNERDRIIPKPAYVGGAFQSAGIKWIGSFPLNLERGMDRASAVLILNSVETGQPEAVMESSIISGCRTAASAALAATHLRGSVPARSVGILGCGPINFETLRFLLAVRPEIERISVFDTHAEAAERFRTKAALLAAGRDVSVAPSPRALFQQSDITSLATNQITPHIHDSQDFREGAVLLHISLRDFAPAVILQAENIVDDVEHVCSNKTSLHLTARQEGNDSFIRTTIGRILQGEPARTGTGPVIFSPFGLGILDIALGHRTAQWADAAGAGYRMANFLPTPWADRDYASVAGAGR